MKYYILILLISFVSCQSETSSDSNDNKEFNENPKKSSSANVDNEIGLTGDTAVSGDMNLHSSKRENLVIAFYSMDELKEKFKYYKEQDKLVIKKQKIFQSALERKTKDLQNYVISKEKEAQKGALSENQLIEVQQEIQKKQEAILKYEQSQGAKIEKEMTEKLLKIDNKIEKVGKKFSELNHIDILIAFGRGGQFNYINPAIDVTKQFIQYLNENEKNF